MELMVFNLFDNKLTKIGSILIYYTLPSKRVEKRREVAKNL